MRPQPASLLLPLCLLLSCAEQRLRPTFPEDAAGQPVVQEQALLGISRTGDAAVAQLIDAEGAEPELSLLVLDHGGGVSRIVLRAPTAKAKSVATRLRALGKTLRPLLAEEAAAAWPEALSWAAAEGYSPRQPGAAQSKDTWNVTGVEAAGALPLELRAVRRGDDPPATVLLLRRQRAPQRPDQPPDQKGVPAGRVEIEVAKFPLAGDAVDSALWIDGDTVWLLAGSVLGGDGPLHRTVGLRRGSLSRGEAELHDAEGLWRRRKAELEAAREEFARALAADPGFFDALYHAASAAAASGRAEDAVSFLERAARADPRRVQVLGRDDEDLKLLRARADVRALLGLRRLPPGEAEPAPR